MTLRRKRFCCSKEHVKPQEMFKTGSATLMEGSVERTDLFVISTVKLDSKFNCCRKMTPAKQESKLLRNMQLDIRTAGTSLVPSAPPPHARTPTANASCTPHAAITLLSRVTDVELSMYTPPPLTKTLLA